VPQKRSTAGRLLQRFTLGSGPLRRTSDRVQFLARVLLLCSLATAIAVAAAVASATYTQGRTQATAQSADRHRVTARLLADTTIPAEESLNGPDTARAAAIWTDSAGIERHTVVVVPAGVKAGFAVPVWFDRTGNRTTQPLSAGDVARRAFGQGLVTFLWLTLIAFGAYRSFRLLLDRSRSRRWAADWAIVEPVWTRTVP
jgi:hypothetical protein